MKKNIRLSIILFSIFLFLSSFSFVAAVSFEPQVSIPGSDQFKENGSVSVDGTTLPNYIKDIYTYAISIVGIVAAIGLMFGGFTWLTAGGSGDKVGKARDVIFGSLTGLVLALTSYTILNMINPKLVIFKEIYMFKADYGDSDIICKNQGDCIGDTVCFRKRCVNKQIAIDNGKGCKDSYDCEKEGETCSNDGVCIDKSYLSEGETVCCLWGGEDKVFCNDEMTRNACELMNKNTGGNATPYINSECFGTGKTVEFGTTGDGRKIFKEIKDCR